MTEEYVLQTNRPTHTKVGHVLFHEPDPWGPLLEVFQENLDQGEGWAWFEGDVLRWLVGRLLLKIDVDSHNVTADLCVAADVSVTAAGLEILDALNRAAAGWLWRLDEDGSVHCTCIAPADAKQWWWIEFFRDALAQMSACAELAADEVAKAFEGTVVVGAHPERGPRPQLDGWVDGVTLGNRDLSASLDLFVTGLEYGRAKGALDYLVGEDRAIVQTPLFLYAGLASDLSLALARVWHPLWGWGWLRATVIEADVDSSRDARTIASQLTQERVRQSSGDAIIGAWTWVEDLGFVEASFVPAMLCEQIVDQCDGTIGEIMALMTASPARRDAALASMQLLRATDGVTEPSSYLNLDELKSGLWSFLLQVDRPLTDPAKFDDPSWLAPKQELVCSMGIFNPSGPTVASLEVGWNPKGRWSLYYVLRHTILPRIVLLASGEGEEQLLSTVADAFGQRYEETLGWGVDWLDIQTRSGAVLAGMASFATTVDPDELARRTASLRRDPDDPWARLANERDNPVEIGSFGVQDWLDAITDPVVIAGHQLFIRSPWEGGLVWAQADHDPSAAQDKADAVTTHRRQRALDDYYFRDQQPPLVRPPGLA